MKLILILFSAFLVSISFTFQTYAQTTNTLSSLPMPDIETVLRYNASKLRTLGEAIEYMDRQLDGFNIDIEDVGLIWGVVSDNASVSNESWLFSIMIVEPFLCNSQWWSDVSDQTANDSTTVGDLQKARSLRPESMSVALMSSCDSNNGETPVHLAVRNNAGHSVLATLLEAAGPGIFKSPSPSLIHVHIADRDHPEYESVLELLSDEENKRITLYFME